MTTKIEIPKFKGGNLDQHMGGTGPDNYIFKTAGGRDPWVKVIIRHGRGQLVEYLSDLTALGILCSHKSIYSSMGENQKHFKPGKTTTMNATAYLAGILFTERNLIHE